MNTTAGIGRRRSLQALAVLAACLVLLLPPAGLVSQEGKKPQEPQWPMAARDHANTRYSERDEIKAANVAGLKLAWTFSNGIKRGQEAAPIVVGDTMYLV